MWTECVWPYAATGTECVWTECLCVTVTRWREIKTPSIRSGIVSQTEGSCACIRSGQNHVAMTVRAAATMDTAHKLRSLLIKRRSQRAQRRSQRSFVTVCRRRVRTGESPTTQTRPL